MRCMQSLKNGIVSIFTLTDSSKRISGKLFDRLDRRGISRVKMPFVNILMMFYGYVDTIEI